MLSWMVIVERKQGEVLFADTFTGTVEYIPALLRLARCVDEKAPDSLIRVLSPQTKGVIGVSIEWEKEPIELIFEGKKLKLLAEAARQAGLNYE